MSAKNNEWLQGQFRVSYIHKLGEGSFSCVYKGLDTVKNQQVAVKISKKKKGSDSEEWPNPDELESFNESVSVMKSLGEGLTNKALETLGNEGFEQHRVVRPSGRHHSFMPAPIQKDAQKAGTTIKDLLSTIDFSICFCQMIAYSMDTMGNPGLDIESEKLFIITELGQESLDDLLARRREKGQTLSVEELRKVQWTLVTIVSGLHAVGYVHFDIKPANVMRFDNTWKLIDFDGAMKSGTMVPPDKCSVTPFYMPPEMALLSKEGHFDSIMASRLMDVWSVGLCALEAVFLQPVLRPWYIEWRGPDGNDDKFIEWLGDYTTDPIISGDMRAAMDDIDPNMRDLLEKMLQKDPKKRHCITQCLVHPWFEPVRSSLWVEYRQSKGPRKNVSGKGLNAIPEPSPRSLKSIQVKDENAAKTCNVM